MLISEGTFEEGKPVLAAWMSKLSVMKCLSAQKAFGVPALCQVLGGESVIRLDLGDNGRREVGDKECR